MEECGASMSNRLQDLFRELYGLDEVSRPDPELDTTDPDEYRRQHRAFQQYMRAWQEFKDNYIKMGYGLGDLGITPNKEEGRAGYNKYTTFYNQFGNQNPNWTYDWAGGVKYHTGTSDTSQHGVAVPITADERREYEQQRAFGTGPTAYLDRQQSIQKGWIERALREGGLTVDPRNGLIWDGGNQYFDDFGAIINPTTKMRIGGAYGDPSFRDNGPAQLGWITKQAPNIATVKPDANSLGGDGGGGSGSGGGSTNNTQPTPRPNYYQTGYTRASLKENNPMYMQGWDQLFGSPTQPMVQRPTQPQNPALINPFNWKNPGTEMPPTAPAEQSFGAAVAANAPSYGGPPIPGMKPPIKPVIPGGGPGPTPVDNGTKPPIKFSTTDIPGTTPGPVPGTVGTTKEDYPVATDVQPSISPNPKRKVTRFAPTPSDTNLYNNQGSAGNGSVGSPWAGYPTRYMGQRQMVR